MAKFIASSAQDALLATVSGVTRMTFCSAQPANFAGIAAVQLAATTPTFTAAAAGTPSGRSITTNAVSGVAITASGTVVAIAFDDGATLRFVDTCPSQAVTSGGTLSAAAFVINVSDPA